MFLIGHEKSVDVELRECYSPYTKTKRKLLLVNRGKGQKGTLIHNYKEPNILGEANSIRPASEKQMGRRKNKRKNRD